MGDVGNRGGRPQRRERADRQINAGHSRGLDVALVKTEAKIRTMKTERIYAFDKNGKEISHSTKGKATETALPSGYNYKDAILTHNHPGKGLNNNIAGRIGRAFSGVDIATTIVKNAAEMRAVTKNYTYSMKRPNGGWGVSTRQQAMQISDEIRRKRQTYYTREQGRIASVAYNGSIPDKSKRREWVMQALDRADVTSTNRALREVAKKYGWNYTRKRTS